MTLYQHKTTFGRGEVDAGLYDRFDVDFYNSAAERIDNWFPELTGGVFLRPGMSLFESSEGGEPSVFSAAGSPSAPNPSMHCAVLTVREVDYLVVFSQLATALNVVVLRMSREGPLEFTELASIGIPVVGDVPDTPISERVCTAVVGPSMFITSPGYAPFRVFIDQSTSPATAGVETITFFEETLGTVEVENGTNQWDGLDTLFTEQLTEGTVFRFRGEFYEVDNVVSNTSLTTIENYTGLSVAGERIEKEITDPFDGDGPRLCAFFKGRLHLFSTPSNPTKWWASKAQDPFVIVPGSPYDDAPINYELLTQDADTFLWVHSGDRLYLGGARGEYVISSPPDGPLTPTQFGFARTTTVGSVGVQPVFSDASLLFVNRTGTQVLTSTFDDARQGFVSNDVTLLASHLFEGRISSLAFRPPSATDKSPRMFALTRDGKLRACSFQQEQNVAAWSRVSTEGTLPLEAVTASSSRTYFIFSDTRPDGVGETRAYYVATLEGEPSGTYFSMDYSRTVTPDSGMGAGLPDFFEGRTVAVVSEERGFLGYFDVENNAVDLTDESEDLGDITVGFSFNNELRLLPVVIDDNRGGSLNRKHRLIRVITSVRDTRQMFIRGEPLFGSVGTVLGQELEPQTGVYERRVLGWFERDFVSIQSASIYKARLLSVTREVSV